MSTLLRSLALFVSIACLAPPVAAYTIHHTGEGVVARLADGESVADVWFDIRYSTGILDVVELGPGTYDLAQSSGESMRHIESARPLVIRGAGMNETVLRCVRNSDIHCVRTAAGLTFQDLELAIPDGRRDYVVNADRASLTLRRVRMRGQNLEIDPATSVFFVFNGNLTIEDSIFSDNRVAGGARFFHLANNNYSLNVARISRSTFSGNEISPGSSSSLEAPLFKVWGTNVRTEVTQSTLVDNVVDWLFEGDNDDPVHVSRSILGGALASRAVLSVGDSFTGADPWLQDDGSGNLVPRPGSPVVDTLACPSPGVDQRGEPTGVRAVYLPPRGTDCDYGAIEAQHRFCMATATGTVTCEESSIDVADLAPLGCRLIGGLLDCGGGEIDVDFLGFGDSIATGPNAGDARLLMQTDGNLVLYEDGVPLWSSGTGSGSCIGHFAELRGGNFIVGSDPQACGSVDCWQTGTAGQWAVLRDGYAGDPAQFLIENADGSVAWITPTPLPAGRSFALYGSRFRPGDALTIPGARAVLQADGNFVLYDTVEGVETALFSSGTAGVCAGREAVFGADGNLEIGASGTGCLWALNPPAGGTVLRLGRRASGQAVLSVLDPFGAELWSNPEITPPPPPPARRCADLPADSPDGVYTVVDDAGVERQVYCDMDGGGFMLVGKVFRSHHGYLNLPEPRTWWSAGTGQTTALTPGVVDWSSGLGYAAYGATWLAGLDLELARFDIIAEDAAFFRNLEDAAPGQTGTWYKSPSTIATWFSPSDPASTVCSSAALDCGFYGRIIETPDGTWLEGMRLAVGGGWIHTRPDTDARRNFDGVCSYTGNHPAWPNDASEHWGNGLDIWVK